MHNHHPRQSSSHVRGCGDGVGQVHEVAPNEAGRAAFDYVSEVLHSLGEPNAGPVRVVHVDPVHKHYLRSIGQLLRGISGVAPTPGNSDDELVFTQFTSSFTSRESINREKDKSSEWNSAISGVLRSLRVQQLALRWQDRAALSAAGRASSGMVEQPDELLAHMERLPNWNGFDIFRVSMLTRGNPLQAVGMRAFKDMNLIEKLNLPEDKLRRWLADVEAHYPSKNHYHNSTHVADVTQGVVAVLSSDNCAHQLTNLEILALLIAAVIHDVNHPGVNNSFLVQVGSEEAMLYNDTSVNENGHISLGFKLLMQPDNNFLADMSNADFRQLRRLVIDLVLGTDMAFHQGLVAAFATSAAILGGDLSRWKDEDRMLVLKFILHAVDISNPARAWPNCLQWANLVTEEFFCQGDRERDAGIPVSPLYDRQGTHPVKNQQVFSDLFVKPTFQALSVVCPTLSEVALANCTQNSARYAHMLEEGVIQLPKSAEGWVGELGNSSGGPSRPPATP